MSTIKPINDGSFVSALEKIYASLLDIRVQPVLDFIKEQEFKYAGIAFIQNEKIEELYHIVISFDYTGKALLTKSDMYMAFIRNVVPKLHTLIPMLTFTREYVGTDGQTHKAYHPKVSGFTEQAPKSVTVTIDLWGKI